MKVRAAHFTSAHANVRVQVLVVVDAAAGGHRHRHMIHVDGRGEVPHSLDRAGVRTKCCCDERRVHVRLNPFPALCGVALAERRLLHV